MKGRNIYDRERGVWFMLPIQLFSIWIDKTLESPAASVNVTFGPLERWEKIPTQSQLHRRTRAKNGQKSFESRDKNRFWVSKKGHYENYSIPKRSI